MSHADLLLFGAIIASFGITVWKIEFYLNPENTGEILASIFCTLVGLALTVYEFFQVFG